MDRLRAKKELLGVLGVVVAIAAGATLPIVMSATAGAHAGPSSKPPPVAACSPPTVSGSQPVANFSPPFCNPVLTATPNTGLGDGQTIKVVGTGYSANAGIGVAVCEGSATNPSGCDLSTVLYTQSDSNGSFFTPYTLTRILHISQKQQGKFKTVDCAHQACFLGAADISDFSVAASTPLSFDPSLPLLLTATLNHTGTVHATSGVADISGTVSCTHPLSIFIDVQLTQLYGRFVFRSDGVAQLSCKSGTKAWTVHVPPGNGTYAAGVATADVNLQADTGTSYRTLFFSGKVHLK